MLRVRQAGGAAGSGGGLFGRALFGHTHRMHAGARSDGVLVCNPGSISLPRGGPASYARLTIENAQLRAVTLLDEDGGLIRRDKFRQ